MKFCIWKKEGGNLGCTTGWFLKDKILRAESSVLIYFATKTNFPKLISKFEQLDWLISKSNFAIIQSKCSNLGNYSFLRNQLTDDFTLEVAILAKHLGGTTVTKRGIEC